MKYPASLPTDRMQTSLHYSEPALIISVAVVNKMEENDHECDALLPSGQGPSRDRPGAKDAVCRRKGLGRWADCIPSSAEAPPWFIIYSVKTEDQTLARSPERHPGAVLARGTDSWRSEAGPRPWETGACPLELAQGARPQTLGTRAGETVPNQKPNPCQS